MAYAILETGGKQYKAEANQELDIELMKTADGDTVKFENVLLFADGDKVLVGQPYVKGAVVEAEVIRTGRDPKVISFKYLRRQGNAKTKIGHRQWKTRVRIKSVSAA